MVALAVSLALIFIRLAYSPVAVEFMAPHIIAPFESAFPGDQLTFEGPYLGWNWDAFAFEFTVRDLAVSRGGAAVASVPEIAVAFAPAGLVRGSLMPSRIGLRRAQMTVPWSSQTFARNVRNAFAGNQPEDEFEKPAILRFVERLLEGEGKESRLRSLRRVTIEDATITLEDADTGVIWLLPDSRLELARTTGGIALNGDFRLQTAGRPLTVSMRSSRTRHGLTRTDLDVQGLNPAALARQVNLDGILTIADMPLFGTFTILQNAQGGVNTLIMDIGGGEGTMFYAPLQPAPMRFEVFSLKAEADLPGSLVRIENLYLSVDEASIQGDGLLEFFEDARYPGLEMYLSGDNMEIGTLLKFWPGGEDAGGGRLWLGENAPAGVLRNISAEIDFEPDTWGAKPFPESAFRVTLEFSDGEIHYLRPMPPLMGAAGTLRLDGNSLEARLTGGEVDGLGVSGLRFTINDLTTPKEQMGHAYFRVEGHLPHVLTLLDHEPLMVLSEHGLNPADYFGEVEANVELHVPLVSDAEQEVTYLAEARIRQAAVPSLMSGGGLSGGEFTAEITPAGIVATGRADLRGVPFDFHWTQDFEAEREGAFTTRVELSGELMDEHLHRFGLPEDLSMNGFADVYLSLRGVAGELREGQGTADFSKTSVSAPKMNWHKNVGARADASFNLVWTPEELHVRNVKVRGRNFTFDGGFVFDRLTELMKRADVPVYLTEKDDLNATARLRTDGVLDVVVQAKTLDVAPFLVNMFEQPPPGEQSFAPNMKLTLRAREAFGMNGVVFRNLSIDADQRQDYWVRANLLGALDTTGVFQLALDYDRDGRHLRIESDNAGRTALGTNIFRNAQGGRLTLTADMNVFEQPLEAQGVLRVENFQMVKSTALIQALAEEEKSGLDQMIREQGVTFREMEMPFRLSNRIFDLSDGRASGPSFGFTMEGQVDQTFERMNLNGVVVPAYTLNTLIGKIPLIGPLITGGQGQGLISINYRITGTRENPKVDVNPMSAVTPGILRKLIGHKKGTLEPLEPQGEEPLPLDAVTAEEAEQGEIVAGEELEAAPASPEPIPESITGEPEAAVEPPLAGAEETEEGEEEVGG